MPSIEIRRHTARHHDDWGHLTHAGVGLARTVGTRMDHFDLVASSPLPRAAETAIAMGYGIDREIRDLAVVGEAAMVEIDWPMSFGEFAHRMHSESAIARRGAELASVLRDIVAELPENGTALALSHGAVIEMAVIAATPWLDHAVWGSNCGHCEGVRLTYRDGSCVDAEILRVPGATGR